LKFKIDENLPAEFAAILAAEGFEAATVAQEHLSGAPDSLLLDRCGAEMRVLITLDLDFAMFGRTLRKHMREFSSSEAKPKTSRH